MRNNIFCEQPNIFLNYNSITASNHKRLKTNYKYLRFDNEESLRTASLKRNLLVLKKAEFILGP